MQTPKSKVTAAIVLFLLFAMTISLIALPTANAQWPSKTKTTYALCGVKPNPTGVNQEVLIWVGVTDMLYTYTDGFQGLSVTIERPDGKTDTISNIRTDATGSTGRTYTPTIPGNYTFQTHFPEQTFNWTTPAMFDPALFGLVTYKASDSSKVTLVVQEEPIPYYPSAPLPTEYWTRPIDAQLREWYTIAGNWEDIPPDRYAPYNDDAPESAHILWAKPLQYGGLAGGATGEHGFEDGDAYEGKYAASVIIDGKLFYNRFSMGFAYGMVEQGIVAVDLHTGEELWFKNNTRLSFGQVFYWQAWNLQGVFPYLWEVVSTFDFATFTFKNTWNAYDTFTGEWVYTMTDMPSTGAMFGASYTVRGPRGEIYIYDINLAAGYVRLWNSSRVVQPQNTGTFDDGSWRPFGRIFNGTSGYEWTKAMPTGLPGGVNRIFFEDRVIGSTAGGWTGIGNTPIYVWAFSLKPGQEGSLLYNTTWQLPQADLTINYGSASLEDKVFVLRAKETRKWWGLSLDSGKQIWGPTASEADLGIYGMNAYIAYGKLYAANKYGGTLYCYDVKNGTLLWKYEAKDPYNEILWGTNFGIDPVFITDGKIYLAHSEHSGNNPKARGAPFICLDATTGEEIWKIDGAFRTTDWGGKPVIGDSIIADFNTYDNRIYAIGKGPSATTVSAGPEVSVLGSSVVVKGMVTDTSPGTEEYALRARFPSGVPAVADENMSDWMKYVYMQFARPADTVGVEVVISVLDPNNNYYEVGRATSDANGFFHCTFIPPVSGEYTIYAKFAGSKSYYGSSAETAINVEEAPAATPPPTPTPAPMTDMYLLGSTIGIIIAIVIGFALLLLRKH